MEINYKIGNITNKHNDMVKHLKHMLQASYITLSNTSVPDLIVSRSVITINSVISNNFN